MCTCITVKNGDHYFGRNLDLERRFGEKVVITPRDYEFKLRNGETIRTKYAVIGMAVAAGGYPLYADAANEKGLAMAGLYFPGYAKFFPAEEGRLNLAPFELFPWFLGQYETVAQVRRDAERLNLTDTAFGAGLPVTAMHWMIADGDECIVLEQTEEGLRVYDDPAGVLTNSPPFPHHLTNLSNYANLAPKNGESGFAPGLNLPRYGQGMGAIGLPGDASPMSRFVRSAFNKLNSCWGDTEDSAVTQFFRVLDSVVMVRGAVVMDSGEYDITTYSCCINAGKGIYYYKTYENSRITAVKMTEKEKSAQNLTVRALRDEQDIYWD
ncbi:MAG: choloylglycine hydrolase [Candidatus Heteroscillospira sp.]|jgi:choloylglycine hydrolase